MDNWDIRINLVSEICLEITESKVFLLSLLDQINRTSDRGFSEWFKKSSHSD